MEHENGRTVVLFGNDNPQWTEKREHDDGTHTFVQVPAKHLDQSETHASFWDGFDDPENVAHTLSTNNDRFLTLIARNLSDQDKRYAVGLSELEQIVDKHAGGTKPAWVISSDPEFARVIAEHFDCHLGQPVALLTNVGRDALHKQHLDTATQPAAFNFIALTASTGSITTADTTLPGEIATGGGGLIRAQGTFAHTTGTNTSTVTKTFTANGSDALPVVAAQVGIFNASSVGTMAYRTSLNATATLTVSGDNLTVTETVTAG